MNQVKLGIIGLGNMGSGHCNNILAGLTPELKLTAAAELRQSRRDWAKETLPDDVVLFENGDQLIESGLCDAVIIATPHYEHPRLAILAFEHGLHVMSEKPAGVYTKRNERSCHPLQQSVRHDVQPAHQLRLQKDA